jgi:hypothetical protein
MDLTMKLHVNAFFDQFKPFANFISDKELLTSFFCGNDNRPRSMHIAPEFGQLFLLGTEE